MIKTIGIDPGLSETGIGIAVGNGQKIDDFSFGSIHTSKKDSLSTRLHQIFLELLQIIKQEKPDIMIVEDIFSLKKYPKSGITLGKVTGVILLAGCQVDVKVTEIPVREAKKALTGNGNASKIQLERAVRHFLNITDPIRPDHASDAMALALIGLFRYENPNTKSV
ncbi:MAG: crossover junction endodeoxyribonuclease RuvC [Desulfobacterales bacterium]